MLLFTEVVAAGITGAAARLGVRKSTVSRRLAALEARLGVRLLERTTRRLRLTEPGRGYLAQCTRLVAEAHAVNEALAAARGTPSGTLRVATLSLLGELLTPLVSEFLLRYPQVQVELSLAPGAVDLLAGDFDLALRTGPLPDSSLVARRLGSVRTGYYASPAYLSRRPPPRSPDALREHECVLLAEAGTDEVWFFTGPRRARTVPVQGRLRVPSVRAGHAAVRAGLGLVQLPTSLVAEDVRAGRLVPVLERYTPPGIPVFAVYPSSRHLPSKVRAFLDLLAERRAALPWEETA
ncbi:LysR family transcriptional regulator [Aggregicoccus sp. 17bor-14]|uniref:LysR family transcriptional regulator n=1 Tax=Myxococcaceae TaxID=31 RepID=UPI00129C6846|nr:MULTISPECIES: LysR family transcriptional regulator [Myxococcaceae]MBF5042211.1 LysR family transcriptional regulator [Simulacricoccus sp. 17bor-14]MRI87987.1 LysR family transcriptional regulator [Aggregicoccus sp. 17bor-14]